jgi:hypothetical protein
MAVPEHDLGPLLAALEARKVAGSVVGELTEGTAGTIVVI